MPRWNRLLPDSKRLVFIVIFLQILIKAFRVLQDVLLSKLDLFQLLKFIIILGLEILDEWLTYWIQSRRKLVDSGNLLCIIISVFDLISQYCYALADRHHRVQRRLVFWRIFWLICGSNFFDYRLLLDFATFVRCAHDFLTGEWRLRPFF